MRCLTSTDRTRGKSPSWRPAPAPICRRKFANRPLMRWKTSRQSTRVRTCSKQYRVQPGDLLEVELLDSEKGKEIALEDVLLVADGDNIQVGKPTVTGVRVTAEVVDPDKKGKKVIAFKFRRREGYHRKRGIRAHHTVLKIKEIVAK